LSYSSKGGHGYGNQRRGSSGSHRFGKSKSHTISAKLAFQRQQEAKPSIMDIPDTPANNLVIPSNVFYSNEDLHRNYPLGSFAVYVDSQYFVDNRWVEQRKKPIYQVIEVTDKSPIGRTGTVTPFGKIVSSHQAFNADDNEKFKERAIAEASKRNEAFFKDVANQKARIRGIEERKEQKFAEKNRGQTSLFS
jgi:hypothetical protein